MATLRLTKHAKARGKERFNLNLKKLTSRFKNAILNGRTVSKDIGENGLLVTKKIHGNITYVYTSDSENDGEVLITLWSTNKNDELEFNNYKQKYEEKREPIEQQVSSKVCAKCGKDKQLNEFYTHNRTKDGYQHSCIECVKKNETNVKDTSDIDSIIKRAENKLVKLEKDATLLKDLISNLNKSKKLL